MRRDDREVGRYGAAMTDRAEALALDLLTRHDGAGAAKISLELVTTGMSEAAVFRATKKA